MEPVRGGWNPENEELNRASAVLAFSVTRHRHRHPAGQAADHLRGVPAGRRQHQPEVRRHGAGPGDQPRDLAAAGRRDPPGELARQGEHVHPLPARRPTSRRSRRGGPRRPARERLGRSASAGDSAYAAMPAMPAPPQPASTDLDGTPLVIETPRLVNEVGDDRDTVQPGDLAAPDRRERPVVRPAAPRGRPREGLQGAGHLARAPRPWP